MFEFFTCIPACMHFFVLICKIWSIQILKYNGECGWIYITFLKQENNRSHEGDSQCLREIIKVSIFMRIHRNQEAWTCDKQTDYWKRFHRLFICLWPNFASVTRISDEWMNERIRKHWLTDRMPNMNGLPGSDVVQCCLNIEVKQTSSFRNIPEGNIDCNAFEVTFIKESLGDMGFSRGCQFIYVFYIHKILFMRHNTVVMTM